MFQLQKVNGALRIDETLLSQVEAVFKTADLRESTLTQYMYAIRPFMVFMADNKLSASTLLDYKRQLAANPNIATPTKNNYLSAAVVFMRQLNKIGKIPNWADGIKSFAESKAHKKEGPDSKEIRKLVVYMSKLEPSPATARFKALFCLKYYQGLRDVEIHRLDVSDLNLADATAMVQRKASDDKELIYLFPNTVKALSLYLKTADISSGAVFISFDPANSGKRLSRRSLYEMMATAFRETGIAKKANPLAKRYRKSPHGMRHRYTTKLLDIFGGDARKVMQFTGHRDIRTVLVYDDSRLHKGDVQKAIEGFAEI